MHSIGENESFVPHPVRNHSNQAITVHELKMDEEAKTFKREEDHNAKQREWNSCCFAVHRDSTIHFSRLSVSIMAMSFCVYQLITLSDCSSQHMYVAILCTCIGSYLK